MQTFQRSQDLPEATYYRVVQLAVEVSDARRSLRKVRIADIMSRRALHICIRVRRQGGGVW